MMLFFRQLHMNTFLKISFIFKHQSGYNETETNDFILWIFERGIGSNLQKFISGLLNWEKLKKTKQKLKRNLNESWIIIAQQTLFGPWPLFQFLDPIHSRYYSLDGGSARRKASTYTQNNKTHTIFVFVIVSLRQYLYRWGKGGRDMKQTTELYPWV
jgi:hypothetical protein